jgi:hypothetical protein
MGGHALVGCVSAVMGGSKCGPGAAAGAVGSFAAPILASVFPNPRTNLSDRFGGTVASAIVGGLASVASGGKFANGAVTAAFGYLFNQVKYEPGKGDPFAMTPEFQRIFAGTRLETEIIDLIKAIETGNAEFYEALLAPEVQLPGGKKTIYDVYIKRRLQKTRDQWEVGLRISQVPGSTFILPIITGLLPTCQMLGSAFAQREVIYVAVQQNDCSQEAKRCAGMVG